MLACLTRFGRESLEDWKAVFRNPIERGLRQVLILVQDDFSGLLSVVKGLFPQADIQLCIVHMHRNAKSHLSKTDAAEFKRRLRSIKAAFDNERAASQFEELCEHFAPSYPSFVAELRKKKEHYLCFMKYPEPIRRSLSRTNVVEAVNGQLERIRRNNGGYFQSEETLKLKLGMTIDYLQTGKWRRVAAPIRESLDQLNSMFQARFENEV